MNALVTGATGFVGRHLVDALLAAGDTVTALVRSPGKAGGLREKGVRIAPGSLEDGAALRTAAQGQDTIYHVGGLIAARSESEFFAVNRDGTARLVAEAARAGRPRIVLVSSLAAAGPAERGSRLSGSESPRPLTAYGRSKLAGEEALRAGELPWTIVRPPAVYGPFDTEMLRIFRAARLGLAPVFGDGLQELSLVYGPDLGRALAAAGRSEKTVGGIFYASHPEVLTSSAMVETIGRSVGRKVRLVHLPPGLARSALSFTGALARMAGRATLLTADKAHEFLAAAWTCDSAPLMAATGWQPEFDFAAGAGATAEWYRAQGLL